MKTSSLFRIAPISAGLLFLLTPGTPAKAAEGDAAGAIKVICSNGLKAPFEKVHEQAEKAVGHPVAIQFGGAVGLKQNLDAKHESFDVAILTPQVLDEMQKEGKLAAGSRTVISRTPVSLAMRGDGPKPDISTPEAFKRALLAPNVKSVRWAATGAALPVVEKMMATLGIADQLKAKLPTGNTPVTLEKGEIELMIDLMSEQLPETMAARNNQFVGPFPGNLAGYVVMEAGISSTSSDPKGAAALIQFLKSPALDPALKATAMIR